MTAPFHMVVDNPDPFSVHTDKFNGIIIFNVRGGCLFIDDAELAQATSRMFSESDTALINSLDLTMPDGQTCSLRKIKMKLSREKQVQGHPGIVFKFVQCSEQQIDLLNLLTNKLPHVDTDVEVVDSQFKKAS